MNKHPLRPVTKEQLAQFTEDGAICLREVFDKGVGCAHEWRSRSAACCSGPARTRSNQERHPAVST